MPKSGGLLYSLVKEHIFSDHPIEVRKNIPWTENALCSPYLGTATNSWKNGISDQHQTKIEAT